jgi:2-hydroxy-3-keto-5-methylthiopentenyl-1-phosphate phosphatase
MISKGGKIRVFCDFDGTVSFRDVGATLFNYFAGRRNHGTVKLWMEKRIDSRECLLRECSYIKASKAEMVQKLQEIDLRAGFREFHSLLTDRKVPMHLVSDGLDFYIEAFLKKSGLNHLDIHSNVAHFIDGAIYPSFPYFAQGCGFCGCCKGERIRTLSHPDELKVYVGDGYSDRCAVGAADLIFARGELVNLCQEKGVDYEPFSDFFEVIKYFEDRLF